MVITLDCIKQAEDFDVWGHVFFNLRGGGKSLDWADYIFVYCV